VEAVGGDRPGAPDPAVCVQPLLVRRAREGEDFIRNRSGFGDAVIIARLTSELRCYLPYLPEGRGRGCVTWEHGGTGCWRVPPLPASSYGICWRRVARRAGDGGRAA
jgi:hypothetical protein